MAQNISIFPIFQSQAMGCGACKVSQPFRDLSRARARSRSVKINVLPCKVVDGSDSVDLDAFEDLLESRNSWNANVPAPPRGIRAPMPPDRKMHEKHLKKMNRFLEELSPRSLSVAVDLKRDLHDMLQDLTAAVEPESIANSEPLA